jgi:SsrA-binding protein
MGFRKNGTSIATNRAAYHEYHILEKVDAGIALQGSEVRSMRVGSVHVKDAFVLINKSNKVVLKKLHVPIYKPANKYNHEPTRDRALLLTEKQIINLRNRVTAERLALVVTDIFFNDKGKIKVSIGLAKGKKLHDKRDAIKKRDIERDMRRSNHE